MNTTNTIALITPTGGRIRQFFNCLTYMGRQTYTGKVLWIIVDDVAEKQHELPLFPSNWEVIQILPKEKWKIGQNTQSRNLLAGINEIKKRHHINSVFVIEDDDWYASTYLEEMVEKLKQAQIVAQTDSIYFNVKSLECIENHNKAHGSLFQTAFRIEILTLFEEVVRKVPKFIDILFYRTAREIQKSILLFPTIKYLSIGIKGMEGRQGIGMGHISRSVKLKIDIKDIEKLKVFIGMDYLKYL